MLGLQEAGSAPSSFSRIFSNSNQYNQLQQVWQNRGACKRGGQERAVQPLPQAELGLSFPRRSSTRSSSCLPSCRNRTRQCRPSAFARSEGTGDIHYHREGPAALGFLTSSVLGGTDPAQHAARSNAARVQCHYKRRLLQRSRAETMHGRV